MQQRKQRIVLKNFTFNVGELIIEQVTNETELSVPDTALKAIGSVISTPQNLLGIDSGGSVDQPRHPPGSAETNAPIAPKSRRRRRTSTKGSDIVHNGASRGTSDSVTSQILELKNEAFFGQNREAGEVMKKLHQKGHTTAKKQNVSMALLQLTREKDPAKKIYRKEDEHRKWHYRDTPYEHD